MRSLHIPLALGLAALLAFSACGDDAPSDDGAADATDTAASDVADEDSSAAPDTLEALEDTTAEDTAADTSEATDTSEAVDADPLAGIPYAERLGDCLGASEVLRIEAGLPFGEVAFGSPRGWFLLDYASTTSSIDPDHFRGGTPQPLDGTDNWFGGMEWFGSWAPVWLEVFAHPVIGETDQAGVLGTDFLSVNAYALDYDRERVYRADLGAGCSEQALRDAGLAKLSTEGYFTNDPSTLAEDRPNVPTVPIAIGGVETIAQLDTGLDDGIIRRAVNINEAFFVELLDNGVALERAEERDVTLTTCVPGEREPAVAYLLPEGISTAFIGAEAQDAVVWEDATVFVKHPPESILVCGGVGTWETPGAQVGASFFLEAGFTVVDPAASAVWIGRSNKVADTKEDEE